jgi:hypothetical protein
MTDIESFVARSRRAAGTDNEHRPFPGGRRIAARSWASIGRVRQRFDYSDRRGQSARLKNIGCELRHHRIGPDFGADAFDLDKEL